MLNTSFRRDAHSGINGSIAALQHLQDCAQGCLAHEPLKYNDIERRTQRQSRGLMHFGQSFRVQDGLKRANGDAAQDQALGKSLCHLQAFLKMLMLMPDMQGLVQAALSYEIGIVLAV